MSTVLKSKLPTLVNAVVPLVQDEVKYVRANALNCLSQLSTDFAHSLQSDLHAIVLPPVILALRDNVPHVAGCAARCLDAFFDSVVDDDDDEPDCGAPFVTYVAQICQDCVALLKMTSLNFVREATLGALSSLTSTCKALLSPYVDELVPIYQQVLSMPDTPELAEIQCKAIECVTLLACGVGKDRFAPYAKSVCDYLS
uniref:Importin subunit beta-3 n=1 Tax=Lygus hesperus TaxID=30085 RepID=A0A0A9WNM7_LYGHE